VNGYPLTDGYKMSEADLQKELERRVAKYEMMKSHDN